MDHFPLVVFQTGSGTQTNMNVNEVSLGNRRYIRRDGDHNTRHSSHAPNHRLLQIGRFKSSVAN
jgi:fumarate hydratase class II